MRDYGTYTCKHCNKVNNLTPQTLKAKFCDKDCYGLWIRKHPNPKIGRPKNPTVKKEIKDEGKKPTFTHNFDKIKEYPIPTGTYPMFI